MSYRKSLPIILALTTLAICLSLLAISCTTGNPTIATDNNQIAADKKAASDLAAKLAAATQPTDQAGINALILANQKQLASDLSKLASDTATVKQQQIQAGGAIAQSVTPALGPIWGTLASIAVAGAVGGLAAIFGGKKPIEVATAALDSIKQQSINHAATIQTMSDNHASAVVTLTKALSQSVPAPTPAEAAVNTGLGVAAAVIAAANSGQAAVTPNSTTTTTTTNASNSTV